MALKEKRSLERDELALGLAVEDELLFLLTFWEEDLKQEMSVEQKLMALDRSKRVLACTGRKIGKTIVGPERRVIQYGLQHSPKGGSTTEALMFTPRDSHLSPLVDRIFSRIDRTPFLKAFVQDRRRGEAPRLVWKTGLTWYFRIEGVSGTDQNMVGLRAAHIVGDELAFGNNSCHSSRVMTAMPDADWWYSGVPNGIRQSPFYALDQTALGSEWSRHKYPTFVNPIYQSPEGKRDLAKAYGGENTHGYKTQVMGEWGDEFLSSFPPGTLAVGNQPYFARELTSALRNDEISVLTALGIPSVRATRFAVGWDYGFSPDPSVVIVAAEKTQGEWQCYTQITMRQVPLPVQVTVVKTLCSLTLQGSLGALCCDSVDAVQLLQSEYPARAPAIYRTAPGGMIPALDQEGRPIMQPPDRTENRMEKPVMVRVKQALTEKLRQFLLSAVMGFAGQKLWLGADSGLVDELSSTTERKTQDGYTLYYGPPDPDRSGVMMDHRTDALRQLTDAIMRATAWNPEEDDAELLAVMGWGGKTAGWKAPWTTEQ